MAAVAAISSPVSAPYNPFQSLEQEDKDEEEEEFNYKEFLEKVKLLVTNRILTSNLEDLLRDKTLIKLLNNKKILNSLLQGYLENNPPAIASGGMGSVYNFGNFILKKTIVCPNTSHPNLLKLCMIAEDNDLQYETVNTDKNSEILYKSYGVPNYILEILTGIYISNKISPYTDGFCKVYGGLYDKTKNIAYYLQEKLVDYPNRTMSGTAYIKFLFEMLSTLSIAQDKYCYVHYDLHKDNIMFRRTKKDIVRIYNGIYNLATGSQKLSVSIKSKFQPVIIDYGFSRFSAENMILYPTESFRISGEAARDQNTRYYLDNHLFNSYYDMIMLIRSFQEATKSMKNDIYYISTYLLCFIFQKNNPDDIEEMFLTREFHKVPSTRLRMDMLNTTQKHNIKNVIDYLVESMLNDKVYFYNKTDIRFPPIDIDCKNNTQSSPDKISQLEILIKRSLSSDPNAIVKNHFLNNSESYNFPITVKLPDGPIYPNVSNSIGNILEGSAWQFCTYTLKRSELGFENDLSNPYVKWYNLNPRMNYNDDINIACSVMWQPHITNTPFRFKSDCCRIDPRRYLQNKKEGVVINGSFFNLNKDYGPVGLFKNDDLIIEQTPISMYYVNDFEYIVINRNGMINISSYKNINNEELDVDENSSIFTSAPLLVKNGRQTFTESRLKECYQNKSGNDKIYYKYLSSSREKKLLEQVGETVYKSMINPFDRVFPTLIKQTDIERFANPKDETILSSEIYIRSVADIKPGELIHAANPNPRSVLALTNNGLVLFFVFPGRGDGFGKVTKDNPMSPVTESTGLDLIDLSSLLCKKELLDPLNLPPNTNITFAINLDGGGSSSLNVKESDKDYVVTSSRNVSSYPVGNVLSYVMN